MTNRFMTKAGPGMDERMSAGSFLIKPHDPTGEFFKYKAAR